MDDLSVRLIRLTEEYANLNATISQFEAEIQNQMNNPSNFFLSITKSYQFLVIN